MAQKIETLDSTLRDGAQGEGINFSVQDKLHIVRALDELGVTYIEAGNPGSNPKDIEFFQEAKKLSLQTAKLCAFGATRRKDVACSEDMNVMSLLASGTSDVVIFGKSWDFHVTHILGTTLEENLAMIRDTCEFLTKNGCTVLYDAEHFFTGFAANSEYALKTLEAAVAGGATVLTLCDTMGGTLPFECVDAVQDVVSRFGANATIGIHTHDDSGLAVANALAAVQAGCRHVQGTLLGFGERTGNANLATLIANLQLKMNYSCLSEEKLRALTPIAKRVAEIANIALNPQLPYVGAYAFAHKAGMHIDAVIKNPDAYEHVSPERVGSSRVFLMSEVAGRSMIIEKIKKFEPSVTKDDEIVQEIIKKVQHNLEGHGTVLVRKSGTEPVIRLKVEDEDESLAQKCAAEIIDCINKISPD